MLTLAAVLALFTRASGAGCPISADTNIVYSLASGVGQASQVWVEDLLWAWKATDPEVKYQSLSSSHIQSCDLASYSNLRAFINPGGNAYDQLKGLGEQGRRNIIDFVQRTSAPSAYVGFCAGGYLAAAGYYWESLKEDAAYFEKYHTAPPFNLFPYMVEGSLVDIADDQFGNADPEGVKYRVVNMSNGHQMLYYGGSSFGWDQTEDMTDPASGSYDPDVEVLAYYTDFYGFQTYNLPAAWRYRNLLLTSVHPEADNCTRFDCPEAGSIPEERVLQNRAWLLTHVNKVAGTSFAVPSSPLEPSFDTAPPHSSYPRKACSGSDVLFCDDFDASEGEVAAGLWSWQRKQSTYNSPAPWNVSYLAPYGGAASGTGYALSDQQNAKNGFWAYLSTKVVSAPEGAVLKFMHQGRLGGAAEFAFQVATDGGDWGGQQSIPAKDSWGEMSIDLPAASSVAVRFACGGPAVCCLDSVSIMQARVV